MNNKEHIPLDLASLRRVAVIQEAQGSLCDAEFTRNLCDEVERLRTLNAQLADRLAACSECLTRAAERDYVKQNAAYRAGQEDMRERVFGYASNNRGSENSTLHWDIKRQDIRDLPGVGEGGGE